MPQARVSFSLPTFAYSVKPSDRFVPFKTPRVLFRELDQGIWHGVNCSWELVLYKSGDVQVTSTNTNPLVNYASGALTKDSSLPITPMTLKLVPLVLPANVDREKFVDFGREVKDIHPGRCTADEFIEIEEALYKVFFI